MLECKTGYGLSQFMFKRRKAELFRFDIAKIQIRKKEVPYANL